MKRLCADAVLASYVARPHPSKLFEVRSQGTATLPVFSRIPMKNIDATGSRKSVKPHWAVVVVHVRE